MHADILNEDRRILIYTPKDSDNPEKKYPVIYVLDAGIHFAQMVEYSKYLNRQDVFVIPPLIVVGITNTDRNRDLTPSHSNVDYSGKPDTTANFPYKNSGGNKHFFSIHSERTGPARTWNGPVNHFIVNLHLLGRRGCSIGITTEYADKRDLLIPLQAKS